MTHQRLAAAALWCLVLSLGVPNPAASQGDDVEVDVRLSGDTLGVEDLVDLTIRVRSRSVGRLQPQPEFDLDNLSVVSRPRRVESLRFQAGRSLRTVELTYRLRPLTTGPARIRDLRIGFGAGRIYDVAGEWAVNVVEGSLRPPPEDSDEAYLQRRRRPTDPFGRPPGWPSRPRTRPPDQDPTAPIDPRDPRARRSPPPSGEPYVELRARITPARPYVGQPVTYVLEIVNENDIAQISLESLPEFEGFWAEGNPQPERSRTQRFVQDGRVLGRTVIFERTLVPRRAGEIEIEPTVLDMIAKIPRPSFFGRATYRNDRIRRSSNPLAVEVRELPPPPPGRPPFTGAVGRVGLTADLDRDLVTTDEAATLTLHMTGDAHLGSLPDPPPPTPPGIEVYPPEESSDTEWTGSGARRERSWVYTLAPQRAGTFTVEPFELSYFDPNTGEYEVASTDPLELRVRPGEATADGRTALLAGSLHPIRSSLGAETTDSAWTKVRRAGRTTTGWLPWLALLPAALVLWLRVENGRTARRGTAAPESPAGRLRAAVAGLGSEELSDARAARRLEGAWREYLAARWGVPDTTPPRRWADNLAQRRRLLPDGGLWTDEVLVDLEGLVEDLRFLVRAPELSDTATLRTELERRTRQLLSRLT